MVVKAFTTRIVHLNCAAKTARCPNCGRRGRRKRTCRRLVRYAEYQTYAYYDVTYGEYRASCSCCTTFRNSPAGIGHKALYHDSVRQLVLDRILLDGLNVQRTLESIARDFLIDLSPGFVYDVLRDQAARLNQSRHRRSSLERFSGVLCVDELHLGRFTLLLATDPLNDFPLAFAVVDRNDQEHMRRFLNNLKTWGLQPRMVVTDGSTLYPGVLNELWPQAEHQLCIFHVLQDINQLVLDAVRRLRRRMKAQANKGRKGKRGRPGKAARAAKRRRGLSKKERAAFVYEHRYLIVKRRENLTEQEQTDLGTMISYLPELAVLRRFADRIYWLMDTPKDRQQAGCRRREIVNDEEFQAVPELAKAMKQHLAVEKFAKMMSYLKQTLERRVRTNNHVERTNRKVRFLEKTRYKWRRRRTVVRFLVLMMNRVWEEAFEERETEAGQSANYSGKQWRIAA